MLPPEYRLEVRSRVPKTSSAKPPLLFVHGGYCDAWCWEPFFLPWFAARGYPSYALSLRGHGESGGRDSLFVAGLDDYVADVEHIASTLSSPPVLIGHSMGAAVVERLFTTRPIRAAALLAPVPPGGLGPVAGRMMVWQPEYLINMQRLDAPHLSGDIQAALSPMYFSGTIDPGIQAEAFAHLTVESPRVLLDLMLRVHGGKPVMPSKLFVLGSHDDRISAPNDVSATASLYGVTPTILRGLAHMMMLERDWERAAQPLHEWLEREVVAPAAVVPKARRASRS
jgi:pimeloyl-ACP methyl ester carboxylesterase